MTQEEKEILIKNICAKLSYKNKIKGVLSYDKDKEIFTIEGYEVEKEILYLSNSEGCYVDDFKPYLRPLSSMTEEERKELAEKGIYIDDDFDICYDEYEDRNISLKYVVSEYVDWLNAHYFDYRGLIEKGLALEAPEGLYK